MQMHEHTDAVGNLYDNESAARNAMAAEESFIDCRLCRIDEPKFTLEGDTKKIDDMWALTLSYTFSWDAARIDCVPTVWIPTSTFASKRSLPYAL